MLVVSTLGFNAQTTKGLIAKSCFLVAPVVTAEGVLQNAPLPQKGVVFLVNAHVFGASDRADFVMFDAMQTVRNDDGLITAQGGYVMRDGTSHSF